MSSRAGFYYDGFNLYHAICTLGDDRLKWVCYHSISERLKRKNEVVAHVKVFSAFATHKIDSYARHRKLKLANEAAGVEWVMGEFKQVERRCKCCKRLYKAREEKQTDVSIGIQILADAIDGKVDVVYLVTTDSDLSPVLRLLRDRRVQVEVVTVSTPGRKHSRELMSLAQRSAKISPKLLSSCLLPEKVISQEGKLIVERPLEYS